MRVAKTLGAFIAFFQSVLLLAHFFLYQTWIFSTAGAVAGAQWVKLSLGLLSVSFVAASLLAFRYTNAPCARFTGRRRFGWVC